MADLLPYIVFTVFMITIISFKVFYHLDETLTYGLSNHAGSYYMIPEEGVRYEPPMDAYQRYLAAQSIAPKSFAIPYINQASDSHPPFYYMIVHAVCGLNKHVFSRWQAGSVNIFFALATLFILQRIIRLLTKNEFIYQLLTWGFIFCSAVLSEVTFFRMYVMVIFLTALTAYLFLWQIEKDRGIVFYLLITGVVLFSALTHYGTLIYSALICIVYGIYLLIKKKWKDVGIFCGLMAVAAAVAIGFFPAIVRHVFGAGRGGESIGNLFNLSDFFIRIRDFYGFIDDMVFGKMLLPIVLAIAVMALILKRNGNLQLDEKTVMKYILLHVPAILFFLVGAKSAPYTEERYTAAIYGISYVGVLCPLLVLIDKLFSQKRARIISVSFITLMTAICILSNDWQYLYRRKKAGFDALNAYSENDCICIYGGEGWRLNVKVIELTKFKSVTFLQEENYESYDLEKLIKTDNAVICLSGVDHSEIEKVLEKMPSYSGYEYISEDSFFVYK